MEAQLHDTPTFAGRRRHWRQDFPVSVVGDGGVLDCRERLAESHRSDHPGVKIDDVALRSLLQSLRRSGRPLFCASEPVRDVASILGPLREQVPKAAAQVAAKARCPEGLRDPGRAAEARHHRVAVTAGGSR